jgi:type I restriction enzyme S subunit
MSINGTIGNLGLFQDQPIVLGKSAAYLNVRTDVSKLYVYHVLRSSCVRQQFFDGLTGSTIGNLGLSAIRSTYIPLPLSDSEQTSIAKALGEVDDLLYSLDQLLIKKRSIKQAAMQELLTGKRRLPGFAGEWEVKKLGDHVRFLKNGVNSRAELYQGACVRYLHYGDIHPSSGSFLSPQDLTGLPVDKATGLDRLQDGDLIFADASEDIAGVSKSVELCGISDYEAVSGLHTIAARFDKTVLADGFKGFLQYVPSFSAHLRRLAAGTKVYATNRSHISSAEVRLPPVAEQKAIAEVLMDMSNEIGLLRERMKKACSTKQGMMQQLLTGKIRLT